MSSQARLHTGDDAIQIAAAGKYSGLRILKLRYAKRGEDGVVEVEELAQEACASIPPAFLLSG
jgi:hypothetical protein